MAPRKTTATDKAPKAKKAPTVKKSEDKVVKRPARGYHKFRNGLLNVTPKGAEKELTMNNQQSPLLRLPAEIRNGIWKLVLGGKGCRYPGYRTARLPSSTTESNNSTALLRTCRQIYAEAALMPLTLSMLTFDYVLGMGRTLRRFKAHQRRHITTIELRMFHPDEHYYLNEWLFRRGKVSLPKLLPGLKELRVRVFDVRSLEETNTRKIEAKVKQLLLPRVQGMDVDIKVKQTLLTFVGFLSQWHTKFPENVEQTQEEGFIAEEDDFIAKEDDPIEEEDDLIEEDDDFIAKEDDLIDLIIADEED